MGYLKKVKSTDPLTGEEIEQEVPFEDCLRCGRAMNLTEEGYYSHRTMTEIILCHRCYTEVVDAGEWQSEKKERVKQKGTDEDGRKYEVVEIFTEDKITIKRKSYKGKVVLAEEIRYK